MRKVKVLFVAVIALMLALAGIACTDPVDPVTPTDPVLTGITITAQPTKTEWVVGDAVNVSAMTGLSVTASYDDGTTATVANRDLTFAPTVIAADTTKITVTYKKGEASFSQETAAITVLDTFEVSGLANGEGYRVAGAAKAVESREYSFTVTVQSGYTGTPAFSYVMGGGSATNLTATLADGVYTYKIADVSGDIVITDTTSLTAPAAPLQDPNGTPVSSVADFEGMSLTGSYYLASDIDFGGKEYSRSIIGNANSDAQAFTGVLDGRGFTISNFYLNDNAGSDDSSFAGIFSRIGKDAETTAEQTLAGQNGVVKNLAVTGVRVNGRAYNTGTLTGANFGLVENVYVEAEVWNRTTGNRPAGIIVGANENSKGVVRTSLSNGTVGAGQNADNSARVGGITGWNTGAVDDYFVTNAGITTARGDSADALSGATGFALADVADVNFYALSSTYWNKSGNGLPTLKPLGVVYANPVTAVAIGNFPVNTNTAIMNGRTINVPAVGTLATTLTAENNAEDPSYSGLIWTISEEKDTASAAVAAGTVATVSRSTGAITAKSAGTFKITATASGSNAAVLPSDSVTVTVTDVAVNITAVTLDKSSIVILPNVGYNVATLSVRTITPEFYNKDEIEWSVTAGADKIEALDIADDGMSVTITAKVLGSDTVVRASSKNDPTKYADCPVVVSQDGAPISSELEFVETFFVNYMENKSNSYHLTKNLDFSVLDGDDLDAGPADDGKFTFPSRYKEWYGTNYGSWRGSNANAFTGVIDGKGYKLSNFIIDDSGDGNPNGASADSGLFPQLGLGASTEDEMNELQPKVVRGENGVLRNIAIVDSTLVAYQRSGFVAGISNGLIENCYVEGTVDSKGGASYEASAGLVGEMGSIANPGTGIAGPGSGGLGLVQNCVVNITNAGNYGGGITTYMKAGSFNATTNGDMDAAINSGNFLRNNYVVTDNLTVKQLCSATPTVGDYNHLFTLAEATAGTQKFYLPTTHWTLDATTKLPVLKTGITGGSTGLVEIPATAL